jgi:DNA invertase Pin-like site-specific DNA recombinase
LQVDAIVEYGVEPDKVYTDSKSGADLDREGLQNMLDLLREGDEVVIWKIGRLSRSVHDFLYLREQMKSQGVKLTILTFPIDLDSPAGKFFSTLLAAFAEFERDQLIERTNAGLKSARARGARMGRQPGNMQTDEEVAAMLKDYVERTDLKANEIAANHGVNYATLNNRRKEAGIPARKRGRKRQ